MQLRAEQFVKSIDLNRARILGLDYGSRKIGCAVMSAPVFMPIPLYTVSNEGADAFYNRVVLKENITGIVVGITETLLEDRKFSNFVKGLGQIPIAYVEEHNTTQNANELLKELDLNRKKRNAIDDKIAAMLILENFLAANRALLVK